MILGTRGSPLARTQSGWVRDRLLERHPGLTIEMLVIRTTGDRQQEAPPEAFGSPAIESAKGIFVKEIEEAMIERRIDLAVHSLKDLPTEQPAQLVVSAIPARENPHDALVTREGLALSDLPAGARVGTSSPRRAAQLRSARPDLKFAPVRGNVETRVRKMLEGQFDAVVLAAAGLSRLDMLHARGKRGAAGAEVSLLPPEVCLPAVGQGALAIETRAEDPVTRPAVAAINDPSAFAEVTAERAFLAALGGGCRVPVAALARVSGTRLKLDGVVASPDGVTLVRVAGETGIDGGAELGRRLAREALDRGAGAILDSASEW